jgi:hypothetical protein
VLGFTIGIGPLSLRHNKLKWQCCIFVFWPLSISLVNNRIHNYRWYHSNYKLYQQFFVFFFLYLFSLFFLNITLITVIAKHDKLLTVIYDIHLIQSPAEFVRMNEWSVRFELSRSCLCQLHPRERVVYDKEIQIWTVYSLYVGSGFNNACKEHAQ